MKMSFWWLLGENTCQSFSLFSFIVSRRARRVLLNVQALSLGKVFSLIFLCVMHLDWCPNISDCHFLCRHCVVTGEEAGGAQARAEPICEMDHVFTPLTSPCLPSDAGPVPGSKTRPKRITELWKWRRVLLTSYHPALLFSIFVSKLYAASLTVKQLYQVCQEKEQVFVHSTYTLLSPDAATFNSFSRGPKGPRAPWHMGRAPSLVRGAPKQYYLGAMFYRLLVKQLFVVFP